MGGELFERVMKLKRFSENDAAHAVSQMLLAVNYIHKRGVVHRDLKLENFLYEDKTSDHLKLIDFGFSHVWEPNTTMASSVGTLPYMAPEVLHQKYTSKCDLWSMGVITFILLSGYMPFGGAEAEQIACIKGGKFLKKPERWQRISETAQDFVGKLIVVNPNARLSAEQALRHPFIADCGRRKEKEGDSVDDSIVDALQNFAKVSQFRRACMSVMAWSLSSEESASVRDAFLSIDKNHEGTITLAELRKCLSSKIDASDDQIRPIFDAIDVGQNEEIHYSEFLAAMMTSRIAMNDDILEATFRRFDTDKSGFITTENLRDVLGTHFMGTDVNELIREAGFGNDAKISYDDFIRYLKGGDCDVRMRRAASLVIDDIKVKDLDTSSMWGQRSLTNSFLKAFEPRVRRPSRRETCGCVAGIRRCCSSPIG